MKHHHNRSLVFSVLFLMGSLMSLFAQSANDIIEVRVEPIYFSPNDDGLQDQTFFSPLLLSDSDVTRWRLVIQNSRRKKIYRTTGAGFSALIKWDGRDKKGKLVPDGEYGGILTIWGPDLKVRSPSKRVIVDTTPPLVNLSVSNPVFDTTMVDEGLLVFVPEVQDDSPIDRWQLQILEMTGRTVQVIWSTGSIQDIGWDGRDQSTHVLVPQGFYRCGFQAWDKAGNESKTVFLDIEVKVSAREMLHDVLENINVYETELGLITQLSSSDLFLIKNQRPELIPGSEKILKETALLINAYPDRPVRLDGYSKAYKKLSLDRDLSSYYAWKVYSFLVKNGNVRADRLTVRGRGRSPMFERRSVDLPILTRNREGEGLGKKGGVEIIVEGNGDW